MDGVNEKSAADSRTLSTLTENHNHNKLRKRNVADSRNINGANEENARSERVPLVILPDSTKAWYNGNMPQIPDVITTDVITSGKLQNGVLIHKDNCDNDDDDNNDSSATDLFINREKISVICSSITNPDLTLGELRLLGCSSEGFVNGTLLK